MSEQHLSESRQPEKRVLLKIVGPSLAGRKFETQSVKIGKIKYVFPSPEAVQAEFLRRYSKGTHQETLPIWKKFADFTDRLIKAMRAGRTLLNTARYEAAREKDRGDLHVGSEITLRKATAAFADAQKILAEQGGEYSVSLDEIPENRSSSPPAL